MKVDEEMVTLGYLVDGKKPLTVEEDGFLLTSSSFDSIG